MYFREQRSEPHRMRTTQYILILFFLLPSVGCMPKAASSSGSGQVSLVKIFSKSDGSTLYFAGPMAYKSTANKDEIAIDFSLNKPGDGSEGEVTCNFTYLSSVASEFKPSRVELASSDATLIEITSFEKFYNEIRRKRYRYRYSFVVSESIWVKWMESDKHVLRLNDQPFLGGKKHTKQLQQVRDQVLFPLK
jgi:hypothetical protein